MATKQSGPRMRAAIITGLSRRHSASWASRRHSGKGVRTSTRKARLLTIGVGQAAGTVQLAGGGRAGVDQAKRNQRK